MRLLNKLPLIPAVLVIGYSIINIIQFGLFNIKGIQIPFTMYRPHALTVIVLSILYITVYLKTDYLVWWIRTIVIISTLSLGVFFEHEVGLILYNIRVGTTVYLFVNNFGYPTFLVLNLLTLLFLYALHQRYSFLKFTEKSLISFSIFTIFCISIYLSDFFPSWLLYMNKTAINPPHSWLWLSYITSGILAWGAVIKSKPD